MDTSRRDFFRTTLDSGKKALVADWENQVRADAKHWIRPPFAKDELEFLLSCTRCGVCIDSCQKHALFPLAERLGARYAYTPALDLINNACALCEDWPCVSACVNGALSRLNVSESALPRVAYVSINKQACLPYQGPECGVCVSVCPVEGALELQNEKPVINHAKCVGCAQCRQDCIATPKAIEVFSRYQIEVN